MRYQDRRGSCGAAMVVNMLRALGHYVSEIRVRSLAGTSEDGTDEHGVKAALRALGYHITEFNEPIAAKAWLLLHGAVSQGRSAGIAVDNDKHWVACVGQLGKRIAVVDSAWSNVNKSENGIHFLSRVQLLRRWVRTAGYYGIIAGKAN